MLNGQTDWHTPDSVSKMRPFASKPYPEAHRMRKSCSAPATEPRHMKTGSPARAEAEATGSYRRDNSPEARQHERTRPRAGPRSLHRDAIRAEVINSRAHPLAAA